MNYLAFDIEAANGYSLSSICSIGVVVANENFEVLSRGNIWVNPKTKYNLNGTRKNIGIDLHLDKQLLSASPDFSQIYQKISALLTDKNAVVIGHAVDSDVRMLNAACKRYKLPSINFKFICSQLLYRLYKGDAEVKALSKIAADLGLYYNEHNSEDDAWMSLKTLEFVLKANNCGLDGLLTKYAVRTGENNNFELTRSVSVEAQGNKRKAVVKELAALRDFCKTIKAENKRFSGKTFAVARSLELTDTKYAKTLLAAIVSGGGKYSVRLKKCNCYILANDPTQQDLMREKLVKRLCEEGYMQTFTAEEVIFGNIHGTGEQK